MKIEKNQWQKQKLEGFGKDSRAAWKNIRNWLGWSKAGPPTKLLDKGVLCSKPKSLVRIMNEFFINKIKALNSGIYWKSYKSSAEYHEKQRMYF